MKKEKKEKVSEEFPEYVMSPRIETFYPNSGDEAQDKIDKLSSRLLIFIILTISLVVFSTFLFFEWDKEANEKQFYEKELNMFCAFYGYERMYKDDVAVYCVTDNKAISLLKVQARYLDYYLGGKKYDIRNYKVNYKDCPEDTNLKYYSSKNIMQVVC